MSTSSTARFKAALADRYVVDREIGHGGMGRVYLARDVKHGRQVAIKAVSPDRLAAGGVRRFHREIRLTARLQHPHILPLLDSGEAAGFPYYATPFVRGGSLRDLLERRGVLSVRETMSIVDAIGGALQYAHENQVIHCDIKPENILMSGGHAILADFGISRAAHADGLSWRAAVDRSVVTPAYGSPEQLFGEPSIDARTDVFSLACVVFEMLTGSPPFEAKTVMATAASQVGSRPASLGVRLGMPRAMAATLDKALAAEERRRFPSVARFVRALERAAGTDRVEPLGHRAWRRLRTAARYVRRQAGRDPGRSRVITQTRETLEPAR